MNNMIGNKFPKGNLTHDLKYLDLVRHILAAGVDKGDRTGTGTRSVFGYQMRFDLRDGTIPLLTTKKMFTRGIIHEILWYLQGNTNIQYLVDNNVHIWDEWADEKGDLGPVYGKQWRDWGGEPSLVLRSDMNGYEEQSIGGVDQLGDVIAKLKTNPNDRRMIVCSWNVQEIPRMNLPPCHCLFQFYVANGELSCQLYQRSCDVGLGVPFNIVQYSILLRMIAHVTGLRPGEFIWTGGDTHIYQNHIEALNEQLRVIPQAAPTLELNPEITNIDDFRYDDFKIVGYDGEYPTIKMDVSV